MVEATILSKSNFINHPGWEAVQLEASDGETYRSTKFRNIQAVYVGSNKNTANVAINATHSRQVVTLNIKGTGTTDIKVSLIIIGGDEGGQGE